MSTDQLHRDLGRVESLASFTAERVTAIEAKLDSVLARQYRMIGAASVLSAIGSFMAAWMLK